MMILVSNRLPVIVEKSADGQFKIHKSSGGLISGLREIHQHTDCLWVGYCGVYADEPGYEAIKQALAQERLIAVDLTKKDYEVFYNGACNNAIWPLFHYFPEAVATNPDHWPAYIAVNQAFSETIKNIAHPNDQIWVHDYQLMLLPALLRQSMLNSAIAYFHHIPFPSSELFRILPTRQALLEGLLGADFIGFHTDDYVRHFLTSVTRILGYHPHWDEVLYQGRRIKVMAQPLGVDVKMIQQSMDHYIEQADVMQLAREIGNRTVLLGIDRLDYTKGIPERLLAYRQLLQQYPQHIGNITFIQICVPTRTDIPRYTELRAQVEQLVGKINGEFGAPGYTPVQYLYRSFSVDEVIAFYKLARVAIVTPLRDGLNLVCKEYVAARDDDDGVLILSEMAGAAAEMGEALLVNPYDINQFTGALHTALSMTAAERHHRLSQLRRRIIEFDNMAWLRSFTQHWQEAVKRNQARSVLLQDVIPESLLRRMTAARRCLIFLEDDSDFIPLDENSLKIFRQLTEMPSIELTILTPLNKDFCHDYFSDLRINLIAEQGVFIQRHTDRRWQTCCDPAEFSSVSADILPLLERYTHQLPGSMIERHPFSLRWRYRQSDQVFGRAQARDLEAALNQLLENTLFRVYHAHQTLEIRPLTTSQSIAIRQMLHQLHCQPQDLLLTLGHSDTLEEIHQICPQQNIGIHIAGPHLFSQYHLNSALEIWQFLEKFSTAMVLS
jgi:trehalose 6-phosphate synthase/phosphatase